MAGTGGAAGATGGSGGGGGTAGTGGSDAFSPCPAAGTACVIMPFGDSITDGAGSSSPGGGYRVPLFQTAIANAESITFVGRYENGPTILTSGHTFPRNHDGHSGYTIDPGGGRLGISPLVDGAIATYHPHIILLKIGTNDVDIALDLANAPTRLGNLLDRITTAAPNALLVVATSSRPERHAERPGPGLQQRHPRPRPDPRRRRQTHRHRRHVRRLHRHPAYKTALLNDTLHPNDAGYTVMGSTWYAAIGAYLPAN